MKKQITLVTATLLFLIVSGTNFNASAQVSGPGTSADKSKDQQSCVSACMQSTPPAVSDAGAKAEQKAADIVANKRQADVSFSEDILPLLKWRCSSCHQPGGMGFQKSGLDLTSYEGVMKGTNFGPMIIPGDPDNSNLMMLIDWRVRPEIHMPYRKKQLSSCDRAAIRKWILTGAKNN